MIEAVTRVPNVIPIGVAVIGVRQRPAENAAPASQVEMVIEQFQQLSLPPGNRRFSVLQAKLYVVGWNFAVAIRPMCSPFLAVVEAKVKGVEQGMDLLWNVSGVKPVPEAFSR